MEVPFTHCGYSWSTSPNLHNCSRPAEPSLCRYYLPGELGLLELCWTSRGLSSISWCGARPNLAPSAVPFPLWLDRVVALLQRYLRGEPVRFSNVCLDWSGVRPFQARVLRACRAIPFGQTVTYQQLARRLGCPSGARAIGQALAANPWAIIVPCHRVVRQDGSLGGYSAPQGVALKQRLLQLEHHAWQRNYSYPKIPETFYFATSTKFRIRRTQDVTQLASKPPHHLL